MVGPEWRIVYSKRAQKDARNLSAAGLKSKAQALLRLLERDPLATPPPCEKLVGNLTGYFSRRINIQHRLVYKILEEEKTVLVLRMWSHYE
ncbi:Txe/YoeB family addiction module toxin [Corynebacterium sp. zg-331]|uniref:Txe/YoeB family addiction module toxin n=1 Tax=unclassified Corynebacterium TaxID=2624378 RepID=UPI00128DBB15|nr:MULTISPECIES: Txe/YoeB family addiction module toxin [unclassified Corynebacterium]MBC3185950.1 Txe/YoeB family addiction module toxin [Corynebacterium sp. zg-331]MPV52441.1 Txe/YoeB family addiction module toxin [Corynebacterium sp. zg331]